LATMKAPGGNWVLLLSPVTDTMPVCFLEFIPCMDKLFDESILIGSGYTARETLRYEISAAWVPGSGLGRDSWHLCLLVQCGS
jgi:hypothetical protein